MTLKLSLDATPRSVVVTCSVCPPWRALANSKAEGWTLAAAHVRDVHGNARHADTLNGRAMQRKRG